VAGIDPSPEMLKRASVNGDVRLGYAEQLPWHDETFDLVICVNALHHFRSPREAIAQAHRVLRPGGGFVSIGLDPGAFAGTWYVYEFFPTALRRDLERFPTREQRLGWLEESGFERINVSVAERIRSTATFQSALAQGILARSFTSQLTHLTDTEYSEGIARIRAAAHHDESFRLVADLELHSTSAWRPARAPEPCELGRQVAAERSGPTGR
ncbi:MAG TPA: methyltransferase domain-containing protein, partial [Thermoanaerobaculia bacterium]